MAYLTQYSTSVPVIKFPIEQAQMTIGQHIDMDICVPEDSIADRHACLKAVQELDSYRFVIMSSENESTVELNGKIVEQADLKSGDWLLLGEVEFQFIDDGVNEINNSAARVKAVNLKKKQPLSHSFSNNESPLQEVKVATADDESF